MNSTVLYLSKLFLTLGITADSLFGLAYLLTCCGQISQLEVRQNKGVISLTMLAGKDKRISNKYVFLSGILSRD
jgi:hypothetical protein